MEEVREEDPEVYARQFSKYIENEVEPDEMEDLIKSVHEAIRADPSPKPKNAAFQPDKSYRKASKLTAEQRAARVQAKKEARIKQLMVQHGIKTGDDDDE